MIHVLMSRAAAMSLLVALSVVDPARSPRQAPAQVGAAVMAYEKEWTSAVQQQDARAYRRLSSSALTVVNSDGTRVGAEPRAAEIAAGAMRQRPGQVDEFLNTRVFGRLAVVSGRSTWHPTPD